MLPRGDLYNRYKIATTHSSVNLAKERKIRNRTEILKSSAFKLLFNNEITKAILSKFGIKASSKERFKISVLTGSKLGKHSVRTEAGSGSRAPSRI